MKQQSTAPRAAGNAWRYQHPRVQSTQPHQGSDQQPNLRENSSVLPQPSADSSEQGNIERAGILRQPKRRIFHPSHIVTGPPILFSRTHRSPSSAPHLPHSPAEIPASQTDRLRPPQEHHPRSDLKQQIRRHSISGGQGDTGHRGCWHS